MAEYIRYYHDDRTFLGLAKQTPSERASGPLGNNSGKVISIPRLGGLHRRYDPAA
jgi:hypothetical protein